MEIHLKDQNNVLLNELDDDYKVFSDYPAIDGHILHIIDNNPLSQVKDLEDISQVEKYVMSKEDYKKRPITVKKWFKQLKIDKPEMFLKTTNNPNYGLEFIIDPEHQKDLADVIDVGSRCIVSN